MKYLPLFLFISCTSPYTKSVTMTNPYPEDTLYCFTRCTSRAFEVRPERFALPPKSEQEIEIKLENPEFVFNSHEYLFIESIASDGEKLYDTLLLNLR